MGQQVRYGRRRSHGAGALIAAVILVVAALIADLAATPLQDIGIPLLNGLLPILIMFCLEVIICLLYTSDAADE